MKNGILALGFVLFAALANSQVSNMYWHHLNTEKGFNQSVCRNIAKDHNGYIWIAAQTGLFRYNGTTLTDMTKDNEDLNSLLFNTLKVHPSGDMYCSYQNSKIIRYLNRENRFEIIDLAKSEFPIKPLMGTSIMHIDNTGIIWLTINFNRIALYNPYKDQLTTFPLPFNLISSYVFIHFDKTDVFKSVFYAFDAENSKIVQGFLNKDYSLKWAESKSFSIKYPYRAYMSDPHNLWYQIVDSAEFINYNWNSEKVKRYSAYKGEKLVLNTSTEIHPDNSGNLWISGSKGLYKLDTKAQKITDHYTNNTADKRSLAGGAIPLLIDDENILWCAVFGKGLDYCQLHGPRFNHVFGAEEAQLSGSGNFIRAMTTGLDGKLYCSVQENGILVFDSTYRFLSKLQHPQLNSNNKEALLTDRNGNIWTGGKTLQKINPKSNEILSYVLTKHNTYGITALYELRNGDLLVGTYNGFVLFNTKEKKFSANHIHYGHQVTDCFFELPNGNILAGERDRGLNQYRITANSFEFVSTLDSTLRVKSITRGEGNTLLIAANKGIYKYNTESGKLLKEQWLTDLMPDKFTYAILADSKGYYWASTNNGLIRWHETTKSFHHFGMEYGLQELEFNTHGFAISRNGDLLFGGVNGFNVIPASVPDSIPVWSPRLQITAVSSNEKKRDFEPYLKEQPEIRLDPNTRSLEISFETIEYFVPEKIRVRYRLLNYDDTWSTDAGQGSARFANLAAGNYTFQIESTNSKGQWNGAVQNLQFVIIPFWWDTLYARLIFSAFIFFLLYVISRAYVSYKVQREHELMERKITVQRERERIMADLHDDVGATLSSLNIYSDLAAAHFESKPDASKELLEKIKIQSKDLMLRMNDIIWSLRSQSEGTQSFAERLKNFCNETLAPKGIAVHYEIDELTEQEIINPAVKKNLQLIAKEIINNIAKHSNASAVTIALKRSKQELILQFSDNGIGFRPEDTKGGNGLGNIKKRCIQMQGSCLINSAPQEGCTMELRIPIAIISHITNE